MPMFTNRYDIITIGGGLGASVLAGAMAEGGVKVLVLEQELRFKDRVRGEFVTPWGAAEAKELGVLDVLCRKCAIEVPWVDMGMGPRNLIETTPLQRPGIAYSHPEMQETLIGEAEAAGAEVRRGVVVHGIEPGESPAVVVGSGGHSERISSRLIVAADGRNSAARKWAGFAVEKFPLPFLFAGVLLEDVSAPQDRFTAIFNPGLGTIGAVVPQTKGRFRAYVGYPTTADYRLQGNERVNLFLGEAAKAAPILGEYCAKAKCIGPLASFDVSELWVDHPYRNGIALIGDAAATSDPTFGQGMPLTLRDARVLRDALLNNSDWDAAGHRYAEQHDAYFHNCHTATGWYRSLFQEQSPEATLRRQKAMPLIEKDQTRVPDHLFSGPELPVDDEVRARFFGER